ncbi:MAG: YdeI/OmpD-associated family protein [Bacteroidota bacterium]
MQAPDPRIDAYIEKSADFSKPILKHLRKLVHKACPEVNETIKWSFACFDYKGIFCSMAAFKQHCTFGFWKTALIADPNGILSEKSNDAMGCLGRITSMEDLPPDKVIIQFIKEAKRLNDENIKLPPRPKKTDGKEIDTPVDLQDALAKNKTAKLQFEKFSPSKKKDYIEWITEAKTEPTRIKRLATAVEWISEGKGRNWKYEKC